MSSLRHDLAIDLGTANTVICKNGEIVLDERSAVALLPYDETHAQFIEVGNRAASAMWENWRIKVVYPFNYIDAPQYQGSDEYLLSRLMRKKEVKLSLLDRLKGERPEIVLTTPTVIPDHLSVLLGSIGKKFHCKTYNILKPLAAAFELGAEVYENGGMLVDIGSSGSVISVVANACIVQEGYTHVAGKHFSQLLIPFVAEEHGTQIGFSTAERVKIEIGSASQDGPNDGYSLIGPDVTTGQPKRITLTSYEIASCLNESLLELENEIRNVLNFTPPELIEKIAKGGIHLIGGSAQLRNLDKRLSENLGILCRVVDNPRHIVAQGAYKAMVEESGLLLTL